MDNKIEIKGYITNLGKYNEGELIGEWISFPISDEELEEVFERIGINEQYEEYFFTDWECDFDDDFEEYESIARVNEIANKLNETDYYTICAALEVWSLRDVLEMDFDYLYLYSDIEDDYDLGYYYAIECECSTIPNHLINYINFSSYGRDIRFEMNGGHTKYGWIEYRW